jgi:hypothetical protein
MKPRRLSLACVDDEVAVQAQQDLVGGKELEPSAGGLRDQQACSAVILSSARPCAVSLLLKSAGMDSLPSMVLMVSSHTVAAETYTPCAEVIA